MDMFVPGVRERRDRLSWEALVSLFPRTRMGMGTEMTGWMTMMETTMGIDMGRVSMRWTIRTEEKEGAGFQLKSRQKGVSRSRIWNWTSSPSPRVILMIIKGMGRARWLREVIRPRPGPSLVQVGT
jgi:hypothetical protein